MQSFFFCRIHHFVCPRCDVLFLCVCVCDCVALLHHHHQQCYISKQRQCWSMSVLPSVQERCQKNKSVWKELICLNITNIRWWLATLSINPPTHTHSQISPITSAPYNQNPKSIDAATSVWQLWWCLTLTFVASLSLPLYLSLSE